MYNEYIHKLFETKDYIELYRTQTETIQKMLLIDSQEEFEDFLNEYDLEECVFWLYYTAIHGESLLIEGYNGDITETVMDFLKQKLPKDLYYNMKHDLYFYVDLGTKDNISEQISICNQHLKNTGYSILLHYDESYCAGVYFLEVVCK